jgi:hypothetical protein
MRRAWVASLLLFGYSFLPHCPVFAQFDPNSTPQLTPAELEAKQTLEAQQKSQKALSDFLRSSRIQADSANGLNALFIQFRMAIPKFRAATDDYRWVLSMQEKSDRQLKEIGTQTGIMLKYLSVGRVNHPKPDPQEFKDYSASELQWETLNSAERISAYLDFAVAAERQETVSQKTLQFLYTLDGELLRLKWLTAHVK